LPAAALSDSQRSSRSSLISRFSLFSSASSTSTASHDLAPTSLPTSNKSPEHLSFAARSDDSSHENSLLVPDTRDIGNDTSYTLLGLSSSPLPQVANYGLVEESRGLNQAVAHPSVSVAFPLANPALPYPQAGHVPVASNICYTCNVSCKSATTLAKHQTEFCERKIEWVCPACPQKVFGLQERLNRHHKDAHADSCPYGCDKREKSHSEACKLELSKCSRHLATKKAWGCPCCVEWFESLEEWSHHVSSHPIQNEKVRDWSYSTMIWSLLKQPYISHHVTLEYWERCTWSTLSKELTLSLRHALERHEVPAAVSAHVDYCDLDGPTALATYAFNLGTTGMAHPRERRTPGRNDTSFYHSPSPSSHITDGAVDSSHYQGAVDPVAQPPVSWSLPAERNTFLSNTVDKSEAHLTFRERASSQANCRPSQRGQKLTQLTNPHCSGVEGSRHLPSFPSSSIHGYGHVNGPENRQVLKSNTNNPPFAKHPPMTLHDGPTSSPSYPSERDDSAKLARMPHHPDYWESRRLHTKKSQANLHSRFAHGRDSALHGYEDPSLPVSWQDSQVYYLENNSRGLAFDRTIPQRPQTASSRSATPARSEGSWTRLLNTSSPSLPGSQYPVAMSLSGPPSDIDMSSV
jgi:hypothetical protein